MHNKNNHLLIFKFVLTLFSKGSEVFPGEDDTPCRADFSGETNAARRSQRSRLKFRSYRLTKELQIYFLEAKIKINVISMGFPSEIHRGSRPFQ